MRNFFNRWLTPNLFSEDEKNERAYLLIAVLFSLSLFALLGMAGLRFATYDPRPFLIICVTLIIVNTVSYAFVLARRLRLVTVVVLVETFVFPAFMVIMRGTVMVPVSFMYVFLIIIAGTIYHLRGIILSTLAVSLSIAVLMAAEMGGLLVRQDTSLSISVWVTFTVLFGLAGAFSYLSNETNRIATERFRNEAVERRRTEAALRSSEEKFSKAFLSSPDMLIIANMEGSLLEANDSLLANTGYSREEAIGHDALEIGLWEHPGDRLALIQELKEKGSVRDFEMTFLRKDGELRDGLISAEILDLENGVKRLLAVMRDVTESRRAIKLVAESQAGLETAQAIARLGSWELELQSERGLIWSREMFRLFHRNPALGVPPLTDFMEMVHSEDRQSLLDAQNYAIENGGVVRHEYRAYLPGHELRYFRASIQAVQDGAGGLVRMSGTAQDITENRLMELAIQERVKELTCLFEVGRLLQTRQESIESVCGQIVHYLVPAMQFPSITVSRLVLDGRSYQTARFDESLDYFLESDIRVAGAVRGSLSVYYIEKQPFIIPEEQNLLDNISRMLGLWLEQREAEISVRAAQRDLEVLNRNLEHRVEERTIEVRQREEALRQSRDELSAANAALKKAARLKDEFLASMSHELRTPLTGILGLSEALLMKVYGGMNEKQEKSVKYIEISGRHLLSLINDILDLSKIEANKLDLQFDLCSVSEICQASLQLTKGMAHQKRQVVSFTAVPSDAVVRADGRRLKQMLVNLLSNAIKFTPEGGSLGLEVLGSQVDQVLRLTVWDKGMGIRPEDMGKLFKPFTQLDSSLARQHGGTGLGLSLVSRLVELHGGSVSVESSFGSGSRFTLCLPWNQESQPDVEPAETVENHIRRCLLIEDNELHRQQITDYMQRLGIECVYHTRGAGALDVAIKTRPDAILLDLNLPDMSGEEVLRELKSDPRTRGMVVIISSVTDDRKKYLQLGVAGYLVKPFTQGELQSELLRVQIANAQAGQPGPSTTRGTLLFADDDGVVLETVSDFLNTLGFNTIKARNGQELVEMAPVVHADVILTDIQMPGMDGVQAIRMIRASGDPHLARVPIVAITALAMPGDEKMCLDAGADRYISKPVSFSRIAAILEELLKAA